MGYFLSVSLLLTSSVRTVQSASLVCGGQCAMPSPHSLLITEWFKVRGDLKNDVVPALCYGQSCQPLDEAAQDPVLECLQR